MKELDFLYQQAVELQTTTLLKTSKIDITTLADFGNFTVLIDKQNITGHWDHYKLSNGYHHLVFHLTRKVWLVTYKKYLSGVKIDSRGNISQLSDEEIGNYD